MRLTRQPLHSCAHKIRYALSVLRGPSRDFADKKVFSAPLRGSTRCCRSPRTTRRGARENKFCSCSRSQVLDSLPQPLWTDPPPVI